MNKPTIEVIVSPAGEITINAVGFKGAGCEQATHFLEEALGQVNKRQRKPEYLQAKTQHHQQKLGS